MVSTQREKLQSIGYGVIADKMGADNDNSLSMYARSFVTEASNFNNPFCPGSAVLGPLCKKRNDEVKELPIVILNKTCHTMGKAKRRGRGIFSKLMFSKLTNRRSRDWRIL